MRRFALFLLVVIALAGGGWYWWAKLRPQPAQTAQANGQPASTTPGGRRGPGASGPIPVLTAPASRADIPVWFDSIGTVQASSSVVLRAMIEGPLVEVGFQEGQEVRAGDILARIDPRPYQAALDQVSAKKAQDEANLANARLDLARYQKLAQTAYASAQQSDTQKAVVAQLEAQLRQDQAQIDNARTQLSYTTITAPIAGRAGLRQIDVGNIARPSDPNGLVVIAAMQPISVLFTLPQQNLAAVRAAMQRGEALVLALPQAVGNPVGSVGGAASNAPLDRGTLAVLDNQVDPATGTIKLKASFPNTQSQLWPGGFVNIRLRVQTLSQVVTVPPQAVQRGPSGPYVYVAKADNTATRRPVTIAYEDQSASVIRAGLEPGEMVVTEGASRLTENARIVIAPPDAPAGDGPRRRGPPGAPGAAAPGAPAAGPAHTATPAG